MHIASPIIKLISTHYPLQDWCREKHPDHDPLKCASVYTFFKPHNDYDRIMDWDRTYFDYTDERSTRNIMIYQRLVSKYTLYFGLFLYLLQIEMNKNFLIFVLFVYNMGF